MNVDKRLRDIHRYEGKTLTKGEIDTLVIALNEIVLSMSPENVPYITWKGCNRILHWNTLILMAAWITRGGVRRMFTMDIIRKLKGYLI
jgi:hypothetical protein